MCSTGELPLSIGWSDHKSVDKWGSEEAKAFPPTPPDFDKTIKFTQIAMADRLINFWERRQSSTTGTIEFMPFYCS